MKTIVAIVLCIILSGCMWQTVTQREVDVGQAICQKNTGTPAAEFSAHAIGLETVTCYTGQTFDIHAGNLK